MTITQTLIRDIWPGYDATGAVDSPTLGHADGNPEWWEVETLCRIARCAGVKTALEIGTFNGSTAGHLALNVEKVYTLDLESGKTPVLQTEPGDEQWYNPNIASVPENVTFLRGDSATFDFSPYVPVDLVFIMGSHSREYTLNDIDRARDILSKDGIIILFCNSLEQAEYAGTIADVTALVDPLYQERYDGRKRLYLVR